MSDDARCKKHFIAYCPDLSETCPYCRIAELERALDAALDQCRQHSEAYEKRIAELEAELRHEKLFSDQLIAELEGYVAKDL